jgi:hypothetical protein
VFLTCRGLTEALELKLWIDGSAEDIKPEERRPLFSELMKKYMEFAKQQNQCGVPTS